jgi:hypothetical protein
MNREAIRSRRNYFVSFNEWRVNDVDHRAVVGEDRHTLDCLTNAVMREGTLVTFLRALVVFGRS